MTGETLPDADALAKRAEIARILGPQRHVSELRWTMPSRPTDAAAFLMARYGAEEQDEAVFVGHGVINEDRSITFTEPYLLAYTQAEWTAFVESVKDSEFDVPKIPGAASNTSPQAAADPTPAASTHTAGLPEGGLWLTLTDTGYVEIPVAA
ncbi:MAG TPA: hypothetical protein VLF62_05275 [Candidatus Saccharimonadales bacterium]|nr:hypothetical protein [Candidatus Saccharimonadales bacterium]